MGDDYDKTISFKELYKGLIKSRRNVMWKDSVAGYSINSLKNTYLLRQSLLDGTYRIDPYQSFTLHEPKKREIMATRIKDRQFQRSLCDNVLYPQMSKSFIRDNCACQTGKGVDDALDRMDVHLKRYFKKHGHTGWVLRLDIRHFFAETPHDVAKEAIAKRVKDEEACSKAFDIIDSFSDSDKGIGLGSQVSQITELAVLDDTDHYIKERLGVIHYIRYADDFIFVHHSRRFLERCLNRVSSKLKLKGLELNEKTCIHPLEQGIKFLKWRFILTSTGRVIRRMSRKSVSKERRKLRKLKELLDKGRITIEDVRNNFNSWKANAERGDTENLLIKMRAYYKEIFGEVLR